MIKCVYCGRENDPSNEVCPGCGCSPFYGPDGLGSGRGFGGAERKLSASAWPLATTAIGLVAVIFGQPAGFFWILAGLNRLESSEPDVSPYGLLERAAALESYNMRWAIVLYLHLILHHPKTREAQEAWRNLQVLRAAHPELWEPKQ